MGFTEIMFIAVIAILFLGPEKLPDAMVQIAKLFKSVRRTVDEAKSSFEEEIHIKELREEALGYRKKIEEASGDITGFKNAIPNPVAEVQDAVASIAGERPLDDDLLADIKAAEAQAEASKDVTESPTTPAQPLADDIPTEIPQAEVEIDEEGIEDDSDNLEDEMDDWTALDDGGLDTAISPEPDTAERPAQFKHLAEEEA
jgi:sec-independent protein translocase protein TatB